ncbi:MAG: acetyltransferase [Desulfovibrionaceae bacterium]|nr:acetyltransferase [Desulfovibrionaceae bacterium]
MVLHIVGAGGHGRVVLDAARSMGVFADALFVDRDPALAGTMVMGALVLGDALPAPGPGVALFCAIGLDNARRLALVQEWCAAGYAVPALVHAAAWVSPYAELGPGVAVMAQAAVQAGARVGAAAIVNTGACVDHDCDIGPGAHLAPGVHLSGNVTIGARTLMGTGSCAIQGRAVGRDCVVGAGAAVVRDIPASRQACGVPAKSVKILK